MTTSNHEQRPQSVFSLSRMIYTVSSAMVIYKCLEVAGWYWVRKARSLPWGLNAFDSWFYLSNAVFVLVMLTVALFYPKAELFRWSSPFSSSGLFRSIGLGLAGGVAAFAMASPMFWFVGDRHLYFIRLLIANALSPLGVLGVAVFLIALAISGEVVYRAVVFKSLAESASVPAAVVGSCLLFAYICPVLSFPAGVILGVVSAILYYRTRNLLAPIVANIVLTLGGGGLTVYHTLMRR